MGTSVNVQKTAADEAWIILNRWSPPNHLARITVVGVATYQIEGTMNRLNRGETADEFVLDDASGCAITGFTVSQTFILGQIPLEAIRVNQTDGGGTVNIHIMQQGAA